MRRAEQWITLVLLAVCLAYFGLAFRIDIALDDVVGPRAVPIVVSLITALLCGILLLRSRRAQEEDGPAGIGRLEAIFAGMGIAYWLALPWAGYVLSTTAFLVAGSRLMGEKRWTPALMVAAGTALGSWALFHLFLGVNLPRSPLGIL